MNKDWFVDLVKRMLPTRSTVNRRAMMQGRLLALEPRMMFDAAGFAVDGLSHGDSSTLDSGWHGGDYPPGQAILDHFGMGLNEPRQVEAGGAIVFIDARLVEKADVFLDVAPGVRVVTLDPAQNGLAAITDTLSTVQGVSAVHIVTHGEPGAVYLGNETLDLASLKGYASALDSWKNALTPGADILLYGCRVGEGVQGEAFLEGLSQATGTQVAASTNDTGAVAQGGDWILEAKTGAIETHGPWHSDVGGFPGLLATPKVTSATNTVNFSTDGLSVSLPEMTIEGAENQLLKEARLKVLNFDAKADKLDFSDNNTIVGVWDEGVLTLTPRKNGDSLSAAQFQAALNEVIYLYRQTGTETALNLADRSVKVTVIDDGNSVSTPLVFTLKQNTQSTVKTGLNFAPTLQKGGQSTLAPGPGYVVDSYLEKENTATMFTKVGYLVANILGNRVDDPNIKDGLDPKSKVENQGMAVVAVDNANGRWQYSTDGGTKWSEFVDVRPESAVLLTGTAKDRIRFVPDDGFTGKTTFAFRAWDMKDASTGAAVKTSGLQESNTLTNGGTTPYSTEINQWAFTMVSGATVSFKNQLVSTPFNDTSKTSQTPTSTSGQTTTTTPGKTAPASQFVTTPGNDNSHGSSLSDDGRFLVFASDATNLVSGDTNGFRDVFLRDNTTGKIQWVSQGKSGLANGNSDDPVISGDGSTVVFVSSASNLVTGDNNYRRDIFRYSIANETMERVSVNSDGIESNDASDSPDISTKGDKIVFVSRGSNLVKGDDNGEADVFLRNTAEKGETIRLSVAAAQGWANGASFDPAISGDGQWVVFASDASNLVTADTNGMTDVFMVAATGSGNVIRLQGVDAPNGPSGNPDISADGSRVVFASYASNLAAKDGNGVSDIFYYKKDRTDSLTILSLDANKGNADGDSYHPALSSDGHFVTFLSQAADINNPGISSIDSNKMTDLFLRAIDTEQTVRISQHESGIESNGPVVLTPAINGDGHLVSYVSTAGNLVDGTSAVTMVRQLFLADVNGAPMLDSMDLNRAIAESDVKKGVTIAELLFGSGYRDVNAGDAKGLAVTRFSGKGNWQFSTNDGASWSDLAESSESTVTLLKEDGQTRIRFIPEKIPYEDGASITFNAWDGTLGKNAQAGDYMTFNGGATAFSAESVTVKWRVETTKVEPTLNGVNLNPIRDVPDKDVITTAPVPVTVSIENVPAPSPSSMPVVLPVLQEVHPVPDKDVITTVSVPVTVSIENVLAPSPSSMPVVLPVLQGVHPVDRHANGTKIANSLALSLSDRSFRPGSLGPTLARIALPTVSRIDSFFFGMGQTAYEQSFWGGGGLPWKAVSSGTFPPGVDFDDQGTSPPVLDQGSQQEKSGFDSKGAGRLPTLKLPSRESQGDADQPSKIVDPSGGGQPKPGQAGSVPGISGRQGFSQQVSALVARQDHFQGG